MKKAIAILLVLLVLPLAACVKPEPQAEDAASADTPEPEIAPRETIYGAWELDLDALLAAASEEERAAYEEEIAGGYHYRMMFNPLGTGAVNMIRDGQNQNLEFSYTINGSQLTIATAYGSRTYSFSIGDGGEILTLRGNGEADTYRRIR